jgi:hypothetical protein
MSENDDEKSKKYDFYNSDFNSAKYFKNSQVVVGDAKKVTYFVDGSDAYANLRKLFISFQHVPTQRSIFFKAFITAFNETFNSDWSSETVYGRADPIYLFKQTQRKISLTFKVPASSVSEAYENLGKIQGLAQFLYPNYTDVQSAQTISQSPLVRLKIMNLLRNTNDRFSNMDQDYGASSAEADEVATTDKGLTDYSNLQTWQSHDGLLGVIDNLTINHNLESDDGSFVIGQNAILPKFLDVNLSFSPIHEHALGWDENGIFGGTSGRPDEQRLWPYGVNLKDAEKLYEEDVQAGNDIDKLIEDGQGASEARESEDAAVANAEARYAGLFGQMRLKKDLESGSEAALDYAVSQATAGEYSDKQIDKLQSAIEVGTTSEEGFGSE